MVYVVVCLLAACTARITVHAQSAQHPPSSIRSRGGRAMCNAFEELQNATHTVTVFAALALATPRTSTGSTPQEASGARNRVGGPTVALTIMYQVDHRNDSASPPQKTPGMAPSAVWCDGVRLDSKSHQLRASQAHHRWVVTAQWEQRASAATGGEPCDTVSLGFTGLPAPLKVSLCAQTSVRSVHSSACVPVFLSPHSESVRAVTLDVAFEWVKHMLGHVGRVYLNACNRYDEVYSAVWRRFQLRSNPQLRDRIVVTKWNWVETYAARGVQLPTFAHELVVGHASSHLDPYHMQSWVSSKCVLESRGKTTWMMVMDIDERVGTAGLRTESTDTVSTLDKFLGNEAESNHLHKFCEFDVTHGGMKDMKRTKTAYRVSPACTFVVLPHAGSAVERGTPAAFCNSHPDVPTFGECNRSTTLHGNVPAMHILHNRLNRRIQRNKMSTKTGCC